MEIKWDLGVAEVLFREAEPKCPLAVRVAYLRAVETSMNMVIEWIEARLHSLGDSIRVNKRHPREHKPCNKCCRSFLKGRQKVLEERKVQVVVLIKCSLLVATLVYAHIFVHLFGDLAGYFHPHDGEQSKSIE